MTANVTLKTVRQWWSRHPGKWLAGVSLEGATGYLKQAQSLAVSLAVLVVIIAVVMILVRQLSATAVVVEPLKVPQSLAKAGFTPEVTAQWIVDQMLRIQQEATTRKERNVLVSEASRFDAEMPGAGLSVKTIGTIVRESLGMSEPTVSGEIVESGDGYRLQLRFIDASRYETRTIPPLPTDTAETSVESGQSVDELIQLGAAAVVEMLNPLVLASYLFDRDHKKHAARIKALLEVCLTNDSPEDDAWAYNLRGIAFAREQDYGAAIDNYALAFDANPGFALALNNWGNALLEYRTRDGYEQAATKFEAAIALDGSLKEARSGLEYAHGMVHMENETWEDAARSFETAVGHDGEFPDAHAQWARSLHFQADQAKAQNDLPRANALAVQAVDHYKKAANLLSGDTPYDSLISAVCENFQIECSQ